MDSSDIVRPSNAASRPGGGKEYIDHLQAIQERGECPFCPERLAHEHKRPILEETDSWLLTENMYPADGAAEHLLAIHKVHIENMTDLSEKAWSELRSLVMGEAAVRHMDGGTFILRWGDGRYNGSSVAHLHAHLVSGPGSDSSEPVLTRIG